jgi:hypothetical protein
MNEERGNSVLPKRIDTYISSGDREVHEITIEFPADALVLKDVSSGMISKIAQELPFPTK